MADRFPLILNNTSSTIQELPSGDNLDLSGCNISNVANILATGLTVSNATGVVNFITTSNVSLGAVANLKITGGTASQFLQTDGAGNLSFVTVGGSISNGNSNVSIATSGGNVTTSVGGTANVIIATSTGANISGYANIGNLVLTKYNENVVAGGSVSGTVTPNVATGTIFNYTLTGSVTISSLASAVAGSGATLILTQGGSGSYTLTSTMKFLGGTKTLSTAVGAIDIMSVFYDGTTYYASLGKGFA